MATEARIRAPRKPDDSRRSARGRDNLPRYDQRLRAAKNDSSLVKFALTCESYFTDEDCAVTGHIEEVDKFDVAVRLTSAFGSRIIWLKKSQILGTEIL